MDMRDKLRAARIELAELLGWTRVYTDEYDVDAFNWRSTASWWIDRTANWDTNPAAAHALLLEYTTGYYETRERTNDHCIVIASPFYNGTGCSYDATVVYLRDFQFNKAQALGYAAMVAAIKQIKTNKAKEA